MYFERNVNGANDPKFTENAIISAAYKIALNFLLEHI